MAKKKKSKKKIPPGKHMMPNGKMMSDKEMYHKGRGKMY